MSSPGPLRPPPAWPGTRPPYDPEPGFPDWPGLIARAGSAWTRAVEAANGPTVLIASHTGMHGAVDTFDSVLGAALTLRGARVRYVLCDGVLQGCLMANLSDRLPPRTLAERGLLGQVCKACFGRGTRVLRPLGLPVLRLNEHLTAGDYAEAEAVARSLDRDTAADWRMDGLAVGEHAYAGALRYYAKGDVRDEPEADEVVRRYVEGGVLAARATNRIVDQVRPDRAVLHHGIYSPQGVAAEVLRARGVDISTWVVAYRKNCFIFSHDDTYHHTLIDEPVETWAGLKLDAAQKAEIAGYLESRAGGARDWIYFHRDPATGFDSFAERVGLDPAKPLITAFTNVMWDAQLHYPKNVFPGMREWLVETVQWFVSRPDLQLLIRVHPAETRGSIRSRQTVAAELSAAFPQLPPNVFVAGPEDDVSSYAAALRSDACVIYGTKMGVELATLGVKVIVAGEAWIRGKGLTHDAQDRGHYFDLLSALPFGDRVPGPDRERALAYAYHFFFRRMLPVPFLEPNGTGALFGLQIGSLDELRPGCYPGLDVICDGVLRRAPFVYPAETVGLHERLPA